MAAVPYMFESPYLHPFFIFPLAVLLSSFIYVVYQRFFHPLASIPGPFSASLSRLWMTKHSWDGIMSQQHPEDTL
jgi:hypothetical protein